jgi:hypothetical protein
VAWIVVVAWIVAVVLAAVILGFGLYELQWKRARLMRDLGLLRADVDLANELSARFSAGPDLLSKPGS